MFMNNKKRIYKTNWFKSKQKNYKIKRNPDGTFVLFNSEDTFCILTDNYYIRRWFFEKFQMLIESILGKHMRIYAYHHEMKGF